MAENGNLKNNNDTNFRHLNNIGLQGEYSDNHIELTTIEPTATALDQGQSERDATHFRLREGATEASQYVTCLSCGESFKSKSLLQVFEHYAERVHVRNFSNCLYCQGKVYRYYHNENQRVNYYHNCLRWKRGEDH
ncbi:uncharacterized protein LOC142227973 [Haematobia irritans]|uniref:uncharacterized protein LOC142227973 n=1 Tax=Haematobia irritans TaxID=7368 RepID=UPI003F4F4207